MEKLLKWSIQASSQDNATGELAAPDPQLIKQLFGGPDEATLMKEAVQVAINPEADEEARETALDNLEMMVESLDNANNLENLGLWEPLIDLVSDSETSTNVRTMACWVIGTAVQNNEKAQADFASKENSVSCLLDIASGGSRQGDLCTKSLYALSSCLSHCQLAYDKFLENDGWTVLDQIIASHQEPRNRTKAASVVNSILTLPHDQIFPKIKATKIVPSIIHLLGSDSGDAVEKSLRCLTQLKDAEYPFTSGELAEISDLRIRAVERGYIEPEEYNC
jgi:hsp70-interacting protein